MNRYGERFLKVKEFIDHCRSLNVRSDEREMEHYEKTGVMLPVVRKTYPEEYIVRQRRQELRLDLFEEVDTAEWPELQRLVERSIHLGFPYGYRDLADDELIHCFDREMGSNRYLSRPGDSEFRPWDSYKVKVGELQGGEIKESVAEHCYSYWQVHQLYFIQSYPDLYRNARLIELVPENLRPLGLPRAPSKERLAGFEDMGRYFEALSFGITVYGRERGRTFADANLVGGGRRLDAAGADEHRHRLEELSQMVADQFHLSRDNLYDFLSQLISLFEKYETQERFKLASDLKKDIFHLERFIELKTGEDLNTILHNVSYYNALTLRRIDFATREREQAFRIIMRGLQRCESKMAELGSTNWSCTESEVNELLDYCDSEGLTIIPAAMSGMVAANDEEEQHKFRYVELYSNLKNVLTSYEYLLKNLGKKGHVDFGISPLGSAIPKVMDGENWLQLFKDRRHLARASTTTEFLDNLDAISNDVDLEDSVDGYWAQTFLVTLLARNCAVHSYPTEDRYYVESFGDMLNAPIVAMIYTWQLAKGRNWI